MDSVVFATGARGSGKSSWLKQYARGFGRVLVWSPMEQSDAYSSALDLPCTDSLSEFVYLAASAPLGAVYAPMNPTPELFDMWCKIVWHAGDCLALIDELADVTPVGKAVGWWGADVRKGRHRGINIAAGAQRAAEIDKTIIGNSTRIVCFRLARVTDRKLMADEIGVDRSLIDSLKPLEFLDADRLTGAVVASRIRFR